MQAQLAALLEDGPWSAWQHRPGGAYLLRADRMGRAERVLLEAVADAILRGDGGDLRTQLDAAGYAAPGDRRLRAERLAARGHHRHPPLRTPSLTLTNGLGGFTDEGTNLRDRPRRR